MKKCKRTEIPIGEPWMRKKEKVKHFQKQRQAIAEIKMLDKNFSIVSDIVSSLSVEE